MDFAFNTNALIVHLKENKLQPEFHKETGQVFVTYPIEGHEVPIFFLLQNESGLLQMVAYLPYKIPDKSLAESARMLHILNKELDMPGFGLDEKERLIFYRAVLPCFDQKVNERLFTMHLGTTRMACETFMHLIGVVVSGAVPLDQALQSG